MKNHYLHYLSEVMAHQWNDAALTDYGEEKSYTFGELAEEMERLHILFRQLGIAKGDKVAIAGRNCALDYYPEQYRVTVRPCTFDDITEIDTYKELCQIDPAYRVPD